MKENESSNNVIKINSSPNKLMNSSNTTANLKTYNVDLNEKINTKSNENYNQLKKSIAKNKQSSSFINVEKNNWGFMNAFNKDKSNTDRLDSLKMQTD